LVVRRVAVCKQADAAAQLVSTVKAALQQRAREVV
jgi:hypothetical protein